MTALATPSQLASYMQTDVDTSTATLLLAGASAAVRNWTGQDFTAGTSTVDLPVTDDGYCATVVLPQRPVTAVTSVVASDGTTLTGWTRSGAVLTLDSPPWRSYWPAVETVTVTYDHGGAVPDDVVEVVLARATRRYSSPSGAESWTVGGESESLGIGAAGFTEDELATLRQYRRGRVTSVSLR